MKNNINFLIGIGAIDCNWNANWDGEPKSYENGDIYGSDKALKYSIRKLWHIMSERVLYLKSFKINKENKCQPNELSERFENEFGYKLDKKTDANKVLNDLLSCLDVITFGAAFPISDNNFSITGPVQIFNGLNMDKKTTLIEDDILSPFKNSSKEDNQMTTKGVRYFVDEAHYLYPGVITPNNLAEYAKFTSKAEYTDEHYEKFKNAATHGATFLNTGTKHGAINEFAMFIINKEGHILTHPTLYDYVSFERGNGVGTYDLSKLIEYLNKNASTIERIEIYYNESSVKFDVSDLNIPYTITTI